MRTVTILFGTETGNAEMVADEIATALADFDVTGDVHSMADYPVGELSGQQLAILITSTYGEGDLPDTAIPFYDALKTLKPDLSSIRFAAFGLGDSSYDTYNNGIATLIDAVVELGATQIGETGRHDADSGQDPCDTAITWVKEALALAEV